MSEFDELGGLVLFVVVISLIISVAVCVLYLCFLVICKPQRREALANAENQV